MTPVPESEWRPSGLPEPKRIAVWKSRHYLAQAFDEGGEVVRLSVNRTRLGDDGRWEDGLSWDELQLVKRQCGFSDRFAVEIYPEDAEIVNVANMRHLWLLPEPLLIGWRKPPALPAHHRQNETER